MSFQGPSQSSVIEQRREPSQFSQSGSGPPPKGPSLDRRSPHEVDSRNHGTDINRLGAVDLKNSRSDGRIRPIGKQTESSTAGRDDFDCHSRSESQSALNQLDITASYLRNHSPRSPAIFNGASGIDSDYLRQSPQDRHKTDNRHQDSPIPTQSELPMLNPRLSLPRSTVAAPSVHSASNDGMGSTIPGKLTNGNDVITPISTSAMSISSGSTPSPSCISSSGRNSQHRKFNTCIMCKRPEVPDIDLLVRCSGCQWQYHTSCHNPKITLTKGDIDVDVETWRCQRCIKYSRSPLQAASMAKSSHSAESSGYSPLSSENSATQITQGVTGLTLSGRESESTNEASPQTDTYNSHPTRRSERLLGNLDTRSGTDARYEGGAFGPDIGPPRKRFKGNIPESYYGQIGHAAKGRIEGNQIGNSLPTVALGTANGTSRSSDIFSENRTLAVVIDNRSRSTSTSTNGRKGYQQTNNWLQTPTVKDPQKTPVLISRTLYQAALRNQSPPIYQDSQHIVIDSDNDETLSLPQRARQVFPPEIKNLQEFEDELTDAPMSLDSTEVYSPLPQCGYAERPWVPDEENRSSVDPEGLLAQPDPYIQPPNAKILEDAISHNTSQEYREPSSPPYSPPPPDLSEVFLEVVNREESCVSTPQTAHDDRLVPDDGFVCRMCSFYIKNNGQYKDKLCGSCVINTSKRHTSHQVSKSPAPAPKSPALAPKSPALVPKSPVPGQEVSKEPLRPAQLSSSTPGIRFLLNRHQLSKPPSSKIHDSANRPVTANKVEKSRDLGSGERVQIQTSAPVKKFQTSKHMVMERYRMTFPDILESQGNTNPPISNTNLTNLSKRKREEPAPRRRISIGEALEKGKGKAIIINEKPAKAAIPVKVATPAIVVAPARVATPIQVVTSVQVVTPVQVMTPVQFPTPAYAATPTNIVTPAKVATPANLVTPAKVITPTGPARKFPSKPIPLNTPPSTKGPRHICANRPATCEEGVSSKKTGRRGPAIKNAGQIFVSISSDESDESDNEDQVKGLKEKLRGCEQKLRDQKGYTRKQVEKSVELEKKLLQSEKGYKEVLRQLQEKLEAATHLAVSQQSTSQSSTQSRQIKKLKRPVQSNRNDEPELNGQPSRFTLGGRTSEPRRGPSMKELYKDYKFILDDPWGYPASPELPASDHNTFRTQSWQKTPYKFWDQAKLMNIHIHRELTFNRGPIDIMTQPFFDDQSNHHSPTENSRSVSLGDPDDEFRWPGGGYRTTFDDFMGIPENMVPAVKGANLGFRAGILNPRTRRLDRGLTHYKIRAPGDLMDGT